MIRIIDGYKWAKIIRARMHGSPSFTAAAARLILTEPPERHAEILAGLLEIIGIEGIVEDTEQVPDGFLPSNVAESSDAGVTPPAGKPPPWRA